jgi:hypothetical protein
MNYASNVDIQAVFGARDRSGMLSNFGEKFVRWCYTVLFLTLDVLDDCEQG